MDIKDYYKCGNVLRFDYKWLCCNNAEYHFINFITFIVCCCYEAIAYFHCLGGSFKLMTCLFMKV